MKLHQFLKSKHHLLPLIIIYELIIIFTSYPDAQATDFYPILTGAKMLVGGISAYGSVASSILQNSWQVILSGIVVPPIISYPLPSLIFFSPFAIIPENIAPIIWFCALVFIFFYMLHNTARGPLDIFILPALQSVHNKKLNHNLAGSTIPVPI